VYPHHDELALLETWTDALGREQRIHPRSRQLYGPAGTAIVFSNSTSLPYDRAALSEVSEFSCSRKAG
jgi:hypothetical protein